MLIVCSVSASYTYMLSYMLSLALTLTQPSYRLIDVISLMDTDQSIGQGKVQKISILDDTKTSKIHDQSFASRLVRSLGSSGSLYYPIRRVGLPSLSQLMPWLGALFVQ